ncbi:Dipeptidyl peptidase IV [Arcticibacter svalbardensis MN12-7]|uniref:Dipeptidyl peptidase IV n=1 Tax=Arcticibacter svalbardensis MN12-7 TaxID=1150600 RepID=R9GNQ2_9SPHI|nr:S9 family peptidase [Arcticibacter svalbardensis]EOR93353.1 Dipeptidyl peptidase IV [Arcticibacter svalbardensis MN12-7]
MPIIKTSYLTLFFVVFIFYCANAQFGQKTQWTKDGYGFYSISGNEIVQRDVKDPSKQITVLNNLMLTPTGSSIPLQVRRFQFSKDENKILIHTNTKKVWRYDTRGDYWVYDRTAKTLKKLGDSRPESSLMFAKFSPDGTKAAYVSGHNLFTEELSTGTIKQLTQDGTDRMINGTFDWAYEEEFGCRDGFRWSADGEKIAYWKIDARSIRNYLMLNTTDSTYSFTIPVEYPKAGEDPSACRLAVVDVNTGKSTLMNVPGDPIQHYIPRMEWSSNSNQLIIQQLNRKQNESRILLCNATDGSSKVIYTERDAAWIDIKSRWSADDPTGWEWINKGKEFIWVSEKDGWRHLYRVNLAGKETLITKGNFDVITISLIDEKAGYVYFMASPDNATQDYLYRISLSGGKATRISPASQSGTHKYDVSPNGKISLHSFSNTSMSTTAQVVSLPEHRELLSGNTTTSTNLAKTEFFKVKTVDGVEMDGWMVKPLNFDPKKKYPVLFYVYGEPASQTVTDRFGTGLNREYVGDMAADGYIYMSIENRGAPAPKGREWRKSIYRKIGMQNIRDQAMAAKEILKWPFVDAQRIAVWGWSGGGSSTLNLMFQYPDIYQTGIAVAAVGNQLMYDNIYQERYMGLPQENKEDFINGSPITHAKNLKGNLLYVHGTGDDNVHYQNAEMLINELVKNKKQFSLMSYPNRSHSINEGDGTSEHLAELFTRFLKEHCPPGARAVSIEHL